MHQPARWRFYALVAVFAALLAYLRRDHYNFNKTSELDEFVNNGLARMTNAQIRAILAGKYGKPRVLERSICLNDGECVEIRDAFTHDRYEYRFRRGIVTEKIEISSMHLIMPERIKLKKIDTINWKVDKGAHIFDRYTLTMIEEVFLSGAVNMETEARVRVLCIGLGAGYVNSYLHHHFPKVNITVVEIDRKMVEIARKWFDLTLDNRHSLVIGDGEQFIKSAVEKGEKYDVVLLDACSMGEDPICPLTPLINKEAAVTFSSLLTEKGVLIANVYNRIEKIVEIGKKLTSYYGTVFKYCSLRKSPNTNLIMTCTQHPRPNGLEEKYRRFMKYPVFGEKLPFVEFICAHCIT